jgi:hypothetical protein
VGCSSKRRAGREARAQFLEEPDLTQPAIFSLVKQPPHMYLPRGSLTVHPTLVNEMPAFPLCPTITASISGSSICE